MDSLQYVRQLKLIAGKGWQIRAINDWSYKATKRGETTRYFQMCLTTGTVICPAGINRRRIPAPLGYKLWELFDGEITCHHAFYEQDNEWKPVYPLLTSDLPSLVTQIDNTY